MPRNAGIRSITGIDGKNNFCRLLMKGDKHAGFGVVPFAEAAKI